MWESIIERLLEKYLSKYIEGIEKEKLRVGVLRGDVELEDLKVKQTALDDCDLGVSILYGNVGRLSLGISWAKWMSQDFNLRLKIKNVHILLKPRAQDSFVSEEQLREKIRDGKEKHVIRLQKVFIEAIKNTTRINDNSKHTTFLMNFTSRLIRNIEIDIMDVHIAFHDPSRHFTLGCELIIGSLQSATLNKVAELLVKNKRIGNSTDDFIGSTENVSQCVEFRGFSLYVGLSRIAEWDDIIAASMRHDSELLKNLVTRLLTRIQSSLGVTDHDPLEYKSDLDTNMIQGSCKALEFQNEMKEEKKSFLNMQYILLPLHLSFLFTSISTKKHIIGLFQIHKESQGIVIGKTHLKILLELLRESRKYRDMCQTVLMSEKNKIKMTSIDSLEETRKNFCALFKKKIREDAELLTSRQTLTEEERKSLTFYHDFLSIRNLAKWRAACYMEETRLLAAKQSQIEEELAQARKQQTWWGWATRGSEDIQVKILEKLQQENDSILTSDERKFVSEEILNKFSDDFVEGPYIYELSFELQNFHILIHDTDVFVKKKKNYSNEKNKYQTNKPFLQCNLHQVQAYIWINSCLDREDKEAYEWRWKFCMSDFHILHRNHTIVVLKGDSHEFDDTKLKTDQGNLQELRHVVSSGGALHNKQTGVDDSVETLSQSNTKEEDFNNSNSLATVWNFERRINKVQNELHIFIRMAPLNCFMYQHVLRNMISFTHSILGSQAETSPKEPKSIDTAVHENVFSDEVSENYERLRKAAQNESQDLFNIHMLLCAPIVYYETSTNSGFIVHFGELCIDTQEPCTLRDLKIQAKLNNTQVYCWLHQNKLMLPLLRPVSISVWANYKAATTHMQMNVVLHEVFIELNVLAIEIILQILVELISCISQKHKLAPRSTEQRDMARMPVGKKKESQISLSKPISVGDSAMPKPKLARSVAFGNTGGQELNDDRVEFCSTKGAGKDAVDVKSRFAKVVDYQVFACTTSVFVRRIGFSMLNQTSVELLRAGAVNTFIQLSMDAHCKHIKASILLDTVFASDPSSKTPLFLTLQEDSPKIYDSELFGNTEEQSDILLKKSLDSCFQTTQKSQTNDSMFFDFSSLGSEQGIDLAECCVRKMKSQERDALHVEFESFPHKKLLLTIKALCAIHWQKESIQKILETVQQSRELIDNFVKKQLKLLDYQKRSGVTVQSGEHSLSSDATDALYYTFTLLDEWLRFSLNDNVQSSNHQNVNNGWNAPLKNTTKSLPCLNVNGSLPEFANGLSPTIALTCHITLHTASFIFYSFKKKFAESSLSGITLNYTKYLSNDAELKIFIQDLDLHLGKKCILSSGSVFDWQNLNKTPSDTKCKPFEKTSPLFQMHMRFYKSSHAHTEHSMVYSSCFSSYLSNLTYVYYQKDVSQLYAYLCDGILDVILRKSYQVAYKLAKSSFCLFGLYIKDAVVLVPEDKSCIPQSSFYLKKQDPDEIDVSTHFGSLIDLHVSSVSVRNSYTFHSNPSVLLQHACTRNERSNYLSTLHFDLKGLTAFMRHSETFKSFSTDINGQILQSIDGFGTLQGGELIVIDARLSQFHLSMIREQLTLLLDILNENFSGLSYQPNDIELGCHDFLSNNNDLSSCGALDQCMASTDCSEETLIVEHLKELFCKKLLDAFSQCSVAAIPPVRVSCRVCVDSIHLNLSFELEKPLALCITQNNCFACDVSLYGLYLTYQFSFLAESFVVEDVRKGSLNRYKRFLECFSVSEAMTLNENSRYTCSGISQEKYEYQYGDDLPGTNLQWMRHGIELKPLMPFKDGNTREPQEHRKIIHESISFSFTNNVKTTRLSASLWNPNLFLFTVGMQDVLNFVVATFSFSTIRRYPKPIAMVVPKMKKKTSDEKTLRELIEAKLKSMIPSTRPFLIDVTIKQGVFNFFSKLETLSDPIIQIKGDFNFKAQSMENYLLFNLIQLHNCIISKVKIMPFKGVIESTAMVDQTTSPRLDHTSTTSFVCKPLFKVISSVVINKAFSIKASGLLETLFDAVTKTWYPSKISLLHDVNKTKEKSFQFLFSETARPVMKDASINQISLFTLHVEVPECVLHLSIQDFVVLCCALRNINGDHVSIFSKVPYPSIVAVDATVVDTSSTTHSTILQATKNDNEFKSKVIGNESYSKMKISCDGLRVVIFDDRLTMPTPILKCSIVATAIKLCSDPNKFLVNFHNMLLSVDFMSDGGSVWQPFIEEFNVSWCFKSNIKDSIPTCASETPLSNGKYSALNILKDVGESGFTVHEERAKHDYHESKSKTGSEVKPFNEEWNDFAPSHSLFILSNKALLINVTPYLCQLLTWFSSSLQETFEHFFHNGALKFDKESDNKTKALPETNDTHPCISNTQCNTERTYSYINLTGENFLAFSINSDMKRLEKQITFYKEEKSVLGLVPSNDEKENNSKDNCSSEDNGSLLKIDSSQKLIPTNVPKTLDDLAVGHFTHQFRFSKRSAQEFEIFVFSEIPEKSLKRLKKKLPFVPEQCLLTSLYETRNERVTLNSFLSISQPNSNPELKPNQVKDILKSQGLPAPYLREFPRRMQVVPIVLSRADTKLIPIDFETLACSTSQEFSSKSLYQKTASGFGSFTKKPKIVARVLSTHPSYKLLMLTTCILLENHTGFPLQISFLCNGHEPILMKNPEKYCSPCSNSQPTIGHDTGSSKVAPLQSTCIQKKRQLQYPELNDAVTQEKIMSFNAQKLSYSVCLLNDYLLSIPPEVFINQERVVFSFRPAYMEPLLHKSSDLEADIPVPTITVDQGWSALLDVNCADRSQHSRKPYIRSCRIPLDASSVIKQDAYECVTWGTSNNCKTKQIHMSVIMSESKLNSVEDASLYVLKIFPGFTIVNACPILLNCHLYLDGKSSHQRISNDLETTKVQKADSTITNRLSSATTENLYLSISPFTICHVLSIHPWTDKASLRMRVRFTLISEAEWSKSVKFSSIQGKDDVMSRLLLNCGSLSCIEIEVYKKPYHFLSDNEIFSRQEKGCLFSCPRWLINRTNVNLSILDPTLTYMNVFPIVDNICLLGNSKKTEIQLVHTVPGESSKRVVRSEKFSSFVEIPAVGGFSNAFLQTNTLYYAFTLETVNLTLKDVYNATFRCVTICPKYIFINTFNDKTVYLRQVTNNARSHNSTKCMTCSPKTSLPLYWTQSSNPLFFQFKIEDSYAWSGSICPHDEYVGGHDIAVYNKKKSLWALFHIQIIVEKGKFFIVLRTISDPIRSPLHSVFLRNHLEEITAYFHTYHTPSTTSVVEEKFTKTNQAKYEILPHETRLVAWPFPFAYDELNCDVALMTKSKQFLRTPAAFSINLRSNCYRRCLEIKNIPLPFRCFVIIVTRGNTITIDITMETISLPRANSLLGSMMKKSTVTVLRQDSHRHLLKMKNQNDTIKPPASLQITVYISQIGLSCISALLRQELLYSEVSSVCGALLQQNDNQLFEFSIKTLQMDSQLEECKRCVFLAQRDQKLAMESGSKHSTSPYHEILCSLRYTKQYLVFPTVPKEQDSLQVFEDDVYENKNTSGVNFHNTTTGSSEKKKNGHSLTNVFFHIWVERESMSNSDLFLKDVEITLGDLELDLDAEMLNGLQTFSQECLDVFGFTDTRRLTVSEAVTWNQNMTENSIQPPILGKSVTLKQLNISKFSVFVWCSLLLDKLDFLSDFLKLALQILMVSPILELTAAPITFQNEIVNNSIRGSLLTLVTVMKARYLHQLVSSLGAVLGYSSLANIPRAPLDLFRGTVGLGLTVADNVSSGLGTVLSNLTFDADYITRREQALCRTPITVKDGLVTASKDLKEGFISLGEVVTKTIGGAQKGGFSGLLRGFGKGVAGTIIKPVDKLSQAISNVAFGIRAEYGGYEKSKKMCIERRRKPRLLSGTSGIIMKYDLQQAELRECLSIQESKDILCSISLPEALVPRSHNSLVLIYAKQIRLVRLICRARTPYLNNQETCVGVNQLLPPGATNTLRGNGTSARIIWTLNTSDILNVRASSNGVIIRTNQHVFQIPCNNDVIIKRLYEEIVKSQQRTKCLLYIENIADWIGASNEI